MVTAKVVFTNDVSSRGRVFVDADRPGERGGGGKISQNVTDIILCALFWDRQ